MNFTLGEICFSQNEKHHLVMNAGELALEFEDAVTFGATIPGRCSTTRVKDVFTAQTTYTQEENTLLTTTEVEPGVKICNRFTAGEKSVAMDTWVEATHKVYDAALSPGKTRMDSSGFSEIGGGDAGRFFPIEPSPPYYGFKAFMVLRGEKRYLKIEGGFLWHDHGFVDAHFQSGSLHEDITCFTEENPIRTVYSFAETENEAVNCIAPVGNVQKTGAIVSGSLIVEYAQREDGVSLLCKGNPYPITAMLAKELATGDYHYLDTESGWETVKITENEQKTEFYFFNASGLGMRILAEICPDSRIEWSVEAINDSQDHTLIWCRYPNLRYAPDEICDLFHPYGGGAVEVGFNRTDGYKGSGYPVGLCWSMPYMAAYRKEGEGIYYALHDTTGGFKHLLRREFGRAEKRLYAGGQRSLASFSG